MRHYKIVKRGTIISIALATLAVFLQLGLAVYTLNSPEKIKKVSAEAPFSSDYNPSACVGNNDIASINYSYDGYKVIVNVVPNRAATGFSYDIQVKTPDGVTIGSRKSSDPISILPNEFPGLYNIDLPVGAYNVPLTVTAVFTNSFLNIQPNCTTTSTYTLIPYSASGTAALTVDPTTIDLKTDPSASIRVTFTIDGVNGATSYKVFVTDCAGTPQEKAGGALGSALFQGSFNWIPQETTCTSATREVTLKVFDISGNMLKMDRKTVSVNGADATITPDPDAGKLPPQEIGLSNRVFSLAGINVKIATIDSGLGDVVDIILNILAYLIGILAFVGIVYGGILYITAGGDDAKAEKGKKTLIYSIFGIILATLAASIIVMIKSLIY